MPEIFSKHTAHHTFNAHPLLSVIIVVVVVVVFGRCPSSNTEGCMSPCRRVMYCECNKTKTLIINRTVLLRWMLLPSPPPHTHLSAAAAPEKKRTRCCCFFINRNFSPLLAFALTFHACGCVAAMDAASVCLEFYHVMKKFSLVFFFLSRCVQFWLPLPLVLLLLLLAF
jgi:hypothetical protein